MSDVYTLGEIAQAAGVTPARAEALVASRNLRPVAGTTTFFPPSEAVAAVLLLRADGGRSTALLFESQAEFAHASPRFPIAISSALHAGIAAGLVLLSTIGSPQAADSARLQDEPLRTRLVFIAMPGPGGGGGGGGLRHSTPAARALRKGKASLDSPVPVRTPPTPIEPAPEPDPPKVTPEPVPTVVAPVAAIAANKEDRPGVVDDPVATPSASQGPGTGGGAGSGAGSGLGSGTGSGIGPGSGGGMGGGPYRPGSGVAPPRLLREVKPNYPEEARLRRVEGEVVLDIVVLSDGSVGDVTLVRGLPNGMNERAMAAVRQWRFAPGTRLGQPVDVAVTVFVEFRLR